MIGAAETEKSAAKRAITLRIDSVEVPVAWSEGAAETIDALKALAAEKPLTINMSPYGGFEQVGSVGQSLPRKDVRITTGAGDIVLYSGDQIVIFYGANTWEYTYLGRIGLSAEDMKKLLGGEGVTVTFDLSE